VSNDAASAPAVPPDARLAPPEPTGAPAPPAAAAEPGPATATAPTPPGGLGLWLAAGALLLAVLAGGAVTLAWNTQQRVKALESELVRRQQDSASQATEARALARQASEVARDAGARMALLEARLAETALQRTQLDDLIQSLARSRDDSVLAEIEAALRVALQQAAITGSVQPLVVTLTQADERLSRHSLPRMEQVRRAVARDLEAARAAGGADLGLLALRLEEAVRGVDELPLVAQARRRTAPPAGAAAPPPGPQAAAAPDPESAAWRTWLAERWRPLAAAVGAELRALVRVSRIDEPQALLLAPEQAYFLRENLKLRLLNARLALMSRQFDTVQADLAEVQAALEHWFERDARRVVQLRESLQQVAAQARGVDLPRPDATLAAIATTTVGR
jgi:uroporphyrin-3 C-methyltransferase